MGTIVMVVPGRLDARSGGSIYNRHMVDGLRRAGWSVDVRELGGDFPRPDRSALDEAGRLFATLPSGATVVVDGMALSAMPDIAARESTRLCIVALVHLPIAADVGLDRGTATRFAQEERRALEAAGLIVVTGAAAVPLLARYGLPAGRIVVAEPGTHPAPLARGSEQPRHTSCAWPRSTPARAMTCCCAPSPPSARGPRGASPAPAVSRAIRRPPLACAN